MGGIIADMHKEKEHRLSKEEREIVIRKSAADHEWDVYTNDLTQARMLKKKGYELQKDHQGGWSCKIHIGKIRVGKNERRQVSENQRIALDNGRNGAKKPGQDQEIRDQDLLLMAG